jgi:hypothetical protein
VVEALEVLMPHFFRDPTIFAILFTPSDWATTGQGKQNQWSRINNKTKLQQITTGQANKIQRH